MTNGDTPVDQKALETITTAYYTQVLSSPKDARTRAQSAYTIASATAGALVTAGLLTGIGDYPAIVQILGAAALAAWLFAAGAYLWVSRDVPQPLDAEVLREFKEKGGLTAANFVEFALDSTTALAKSVEDRLRLALLSTSAALALTLLAFAAALLWSPPADTAAATLIVTEEAAKSMQGACEGLITGQAIQGDLDISSLSDDFLKLSVQGECHRTVRIASTSVVAVVPAAAPSP
jgi:hypothetical protein